MRSKTLIVSFAAVVAVCVASIGAGAGGSSLTVRSSLDGKAVLPHRIHWLGYPVPASTNVRMDFLIDGKLAWHEGSAPYTFADDGGYLVTSWLAPGKHSFTVRATAREAEPSRKTPSRHVCCRRQVLQPPSPGDGNAGPT
jgi:hypothetical protein